MLNFTNPPELPQQLKWKYAEEPELLAWAIRARNYNTFVANCMFAFMSLVLLGISYFLYSAYHGMDEPWRILSCLFFYIFMSFTVSCMTHQRMNFAYRIAQSGIEFCEWKDFPKWALTFLKWFSAITAIIFIYMATIDATYLVGALIGPGGMGLMYLSMANSKSFQAMHTQYHYYAFKWEELTQLAIATNREVVDLKYSVTQEGDDFKTNWSLNVFCKRGQKENIANLIRPYLSPGVPFIRAKVNVPMSTY
jgi:hypothetical protein